MKVYEVMVDDCVECDQSIRTTIFSNYVSAMRLFERERDEAIERAKEDRWQVDISGNSVYTYEKGYSCENHFWVTLLTKEVQN